MLRKVGWLAVPARYTATSSEASRSNAWPRQSGGKTARLFTQYFRQLIVRCPRCPNVSPLATYCLIDIDLCGLRVALAHIGKQFTYCPPSTAWSRSRSITSLQIYRVSLWRAFSALIWRVSRRFKAYRFTMAWQCGPTFAGTSLERSCLASATGLVLRV
jgi:hypothetical protein